MMPTANPDFPDTPDMLDMPGLLLEVQKIAKEAAAAVLVVRKKGFEVFRKADHSPVTDADYISNDIIVAQLLKLLPSVPIISEEGQVVDYRDRKDSRFCWLVDPLDGTREFVNNRSDFTVNIALIKNHSPCLGVVSAPMFDLHYSAAAGYGATVESGDGVSVPLKVCTTVPDLPRVLVGRGGAGKKMRKFLDRVGRHALIYRGSLIKCCLVAEGSADLYVSFGHTSEWDTAAAQCILEEAGGHLLGLDGAPLRYNQRDTLENPPFIASATTEPSWRLLAAEQAVSG